MITTNMPAALHLQASGPPPRTNPGLLMRLSHARIPQLRVGGQGSSCRQKDKVLSPKELLSQGENVRKCPEENKAEGSRVMGCSQEVRRERIIKD